MASDQQVFSVEKPAWWWTGWGVAAAFGSYFCIYALRKPFTAAEFAEPVVWGVGFKTLLVTAQVFGYALAKVIGIRVIAELPRRRRIAMMIQLVLAALAALLLFGILPRPWNAVCLFLNGLPLGMMFGLVLGFLEGRRRTEALAAGLCASFILADGFTKTVGTWLLRQGVAEEWMPGLAGALFLLPLAGFMAMLATLPDPARSDVAARTERVTMDRTARLALVRRFGPGLAALTLVYLSVTIVRSMRGDFAPEIWRGLGFTGTPSLFTQSEMLVAAGVLLVSGSLAWIRDNRLAFFVALLTCMGGFLLMGGALFARQAGWIGGFSFMVLLGLGLYLPYVAMQAAVFERMLAMTRHPGTIGFLVYLIDAISYPGYIAVMLVANWVQPQGDVFGWLTTASQLAIGVSLASLTFAWWYFARQPGRQPAR